MFILENNAALLKHYKSESYRTWTFLSIHLNFWKNSSRWILEINEFKESQNWR